MENTKENKEKFFAQYLNQRVLNDGYGEYLYPLYSHFLEKLHEKYFIELKPLSSITDEDLKHFYTENYLNEKIFFKTKQEVLHHYESFKFWTSKEADILRSLGFAVEWMGLSVEKLQEYGWIKLKSE